jgi:DNA-binding GntR family transcriptional regulator
MAAARRTDADEATPRASRLQTDLAARILRLLKDQGAGPGHHLVELDLCRHFDVSRTPVRGALKLLADQGAVEARANRGYVLRGPITEAPDLDIVNPEDEEDQRLFVAIAEARNQGRMPDQCSQLEVARLFGAKLPTVVRVLRQLAELGLVERKPGNGWSFAAPVDLSRVRAESYAFRTVLEPAGLLEATFELDREWLDRIRAEHLAFRKRKWRDTLAVEWFAIDADFHEGVARGSGNRYILGAVRRQNKLRSFMNIQWIDGAERVIDSIDEHLAILDAIEAGDNRKAHDLMKAHLALAHDLSAGVPSKDSG